MQRFNQRQIAVSTVNMGMLLILLGVSISGLRPLFGSLLLGDGLSAPVVGIYMFAAGLVLFLPHSVWNGHMPVGRYDLIALCLLCGVVVGAGNVSYFAALQRLPIATVTLLYFTYPVMVVTIVAVQRRRWPERDVLAAIFCVLFGSTLIVSQGGAMALPAFGDLLLALLPALSWAVLLIMLAGRLSVLTPSTQIGLITSGATLVLTAVIVMWRPDALLPHSPNGWLGLMGLLAFSGVLAPLLVLLGVPKAGPERASIAGVFELAVSLCVGWFIFSEPMSFQQWAGILLIVTALIITRHVDDSPLSTSSH